MRVFYKENPRVIAIYSYTHSLCFQQLKRKGEKHESSVIVEIVPNNHINHSNGFRPLIRKEIHGFLGLVSAEQQTFLAVITGAVTQVARPLPYESVDKIYHVEFVSLSGDEWDFLLLSNSNSTQNSEEYERERNAYLVHPCHDLQKLLSSGSFYYSNDFDLTSLLSSRGVLSERMRNRGSNSAEKRQERINLKHYLKDYMWNAYLMDDLFKFRSNLEPFSQKILEENRFLTTVIRGFARTIRVSGSDTFTIISRQSWQRAGTRFNARGIDDKGNVANFVETEFIYNELSSNHIYSFTQIRGSVPLFWEQEPTLINPKISLTRSFEATRSIFDKHFTEVCQKYGPCNIVNLLSESKPPESQLLRRYKQLIDTSSMKDELVYTEFDFHQETKQLHGGFSAASKVLPLILEELENFGLFVYDLSKNETVLRQDGIFRVNCLDCLDRTNLVQQVICQHILQSILSNSGSARHRVGMEDFVFKHNSLWADNGDAISQIYTGTNALKSSFSRSGKMNFAGALSDVTKSVSRMYQNTFMDPKKQVTLDLLLGRDVHSIPVKIYDPINEYVQDKLNQEASVFTTSSGISIFIGTFNISGEPPLSSYNLTDWLFPPEGANDPSPDIYAIGIQEVIELNAGSILSSDNSRSTAWTKLLENNLNSRGESYSLLRTESMASMSLFLFVNNKKVHNVSEVYGSSKKTGLGGMAANKGACAVRFEYGLTPIVMVTSHLAAGANALLERLNDFMTIMQGLIFTRNITIQDHEHIFWFGDLNYRISMSNERCRYLIENGAFDELIANDQLREERANKAAFHDFNEGAIKFYPTYKFDKGTNQYDTSEKQRTPSWTDRILFTCTQRRDQIKQLFYSSCMDIDFSDHKPVYSKFECPVRFVNEKKKQELSISLYNSYKKEHGDESDVALVDISDNNSQNSKYSPTSSIGVNSSDAVSEVSLIDDFGETNAKLPSRLLDYIGNRRNQSATNASNKTVGASENAAISNSTVPRRLPPMPSNWANPDPSPPKSKQGNQLEAPVVQKKKTVPPLPPNARKAVTASPSTPQPPIGFSSEPLISRKPSPKPVPAGQTKLASQPTEPVKNIHKVTPIVPAKPSELSTKIKHASLDDIPSTNVKDATKKIEKNDSGHASNQSASMAEWKPLVPK